MLICLGLPRGHISITPAGTDVSDRLLYRCPFWKASVNAQNLSKFGEGEERMGVRKAAAARPRDFITRPLSDGAGFQDTSVTDRCFCFLFSAWFGFVHM